MRKRLSRRRIKARLRLGRWVALRDLVDHGLEGWITRIGLRMSRDFHSEHYRRIPHG